MRFQTSQQMKLGQQMKLAPRVIQSMEILQLPLPALEQRIEEELEANIALETYDPAADRETEAPVEEAPETDRELDVGEGAGEHDFERLDSMESSYEEAFENEYSAASAKRFETDVGGPGRARAASGERDAKMEAMANTAARGPSLVEQLSEQWALADVDDDVREAGDLIIQFLDSDGYLRTDLATIADRAPADHPAPSVELLDRALHELQRTLDPPGVAARDTRECLLLQLDALEEQSPSAEARHARTLIERHMDDLVQNRLPAIAEASGLSIEQINSAVEWMHRLSLAPARRLVDESPPHIVPDAVVEYDEDEGRYRAYLTDGRLPSLRVNRSYADMAKDRTVEKNARDFLRTNLSNAQWLIDALNQRRQTLLRVLNVVVEAQRDFFDQGAGALRPLPMTQVADQLGVHVATVSRAVAGKHLQTPRGVVPLRRFFSGGMQTESGEEMSWDAIKAALQDVVNDEDKSNPLSDEALAERLKEKGIDIARRTVAKYRSQLDIPPARMRKQY